jgi:hypothetical protein
MLSKEKALIEIRSGPRWVGKIPPGDGLVAVIAFSTGKLLNLPKSACHHL